MIPELEETPPGEALFDFDGTLIEGDIGESTVRIFHDRGALSAEVDHALGGRTWERYHTLDPVGQAVLCAVALAGQTIAAVEAVVDEAFALGRVTPRPAVCELAAWMAVSHRVWVLSGSPEVVVRAAAPRVGIHRVMGLRSRIRGDQLTAEVEAPIPTDEGKVRVAWMRTGRRPVFAIGDSPWDLPILRHARAARTTGRIAGREFPAFPL